MNPAKELGAIPVWDNDTCVGVGFALCSHSARAVKVALYDPVTCKLKQILGLQKQRAGYWFGFSEQAHVGDYYVFHVSHTQPIPVGHYYNARHGLLDPYARKLYYTEQRCGLPELVAVVCDNRQSEISAPKPAIPWSETVIYEAHVKGLTKLCPAVPEELRGTYLGVSHPFIIDHLKSLQITTLELQPCQAMLDELWLHRKGLTNYWGYNPVVFMAPTARYAIEDCVAEFKTMVEQLHRQGIEVIVDLVFNHTAEGDSTGPVVSLKGIDASYYYTVNPKEEEPFLNYTGCGNTVNAEQPQVVQLWMDALRVWYNELDVDGFRFDLGVTLGRHRERFNPKHPFFIALQQDPDLKHAKIIMEPWDLGPEGYQVGRFPHSFAEWNGSFRDSIRTYIRGDGGALQEFTTQFVANFDKHFQEKDRTETSINFVTAHDGFTLHDLVSYQQKHNADNGEENRDGCDNNISRNYGVEGPAKHPAINRIRRIQKQNFLVVLALAKGIPMLLMGDELGRTQLGNNNAYCQDNEISWFNWQVEQSNDLRGFWSELITLRRRFSWIYQATTQIHWYRPDAKPMAPSDWEKWFARSVGCHFIGQDGSQLFIVFNMHDGEIEYHLPIIKGKPQDCEILFDTTKDKETLASMGTVVDKYLASPHSISAFCCAAGAEKA